jgi:hypothetical protein
MAAVRPAAVKPLLGSEARPLLINRRVGTVVVPTRPSYVVIRPRVGGVVRVRAQKL